MDLRMFLFLVAALPGSLARRDMHFTGGSMMFKFINTTEAPYKLQITTLTGWVLGMGPCGPSCSASDIGKSTTRTRLEMLALNGATYFGNWTKELGLSGSTNKIYEIITPEMISNIEGHVTAVNVPMKWEEELAEVIIDLDPTAKYTDISMNGFYWRWFNYTFGVMDYPPYYNLQIKVTSTQREDTKKPNNSPVVMFQTVYRILLNKATTIKLFAMDPDGDYMSCEYAEFYQAGGLASLNNTVVKQDCSIVIDAQESAGFLDGGWGAIPVIVRDHSSSNLVKSFGFSDTSVQFMIQTLKTIDAPEFVKPTEESEHEFIVYVGSTLKIPLYAKPMSVNEIHAFHLRSIPYRAFSVDPPKDDNRRKGEKVKYTIVNWRPGNNDVGEYIISALVTDTQGSDGLDRNYYIVVKDIGQLPQKNIPHTGPYFPLFPGMEGIVCMSGSTCSFPIYTNTQTVGGFISEVNYTTSTFQTTIIDSPEAKQKDGSVMFVSEVTVNPSTSGDQRICFEATENIGKTSAPKCMKVEVKTPDPCRSNPCVHGFCSRQNDSYVCRCNAGYTGRHCENDIDFCASNPCLNNGICSSNQHSHYTCDCSGTGYMGIICGTEIDDCKPGVCGQYGVCKDLDGKYECDCFSGYSGDYCETIETKCNGLTCKNGGICIVDGGVGVCKCPLGFSGTDCTDDHTTLSVNRGTTDNPFIVPSIPNGAVFQCSIMHHCIIPVYSKIPISGTPDIHVGLHSPGLTVSIISSNPDPTTNAVKSLIAVTSSNTGIFSVCVNSGRSNPDTLCYKVNTSKEYTSHPRDKKILPTFKEPTPFKNSVINCIQGTPCHTIITSDWNVLTQNCTLYSGSTSAVVFKELKVGHTCETDVLFNPPATGEMEVCLKAGPMIIAPVATFQGERRCFTLKTTASDYCIPNPCTYGGACILQPGDTHPYQCICPDAFEGNLCQYQKHCMSRPCQNGGFCETKGNGYGCKCPVGYESDNCTYISTQIDAQFMEPTLNNGATVVCEVGDTCDIPVFIRESTFLEEGPKDEDVDVDILKHIGKSGANHKDDLLRVTPLKVGIMKVCINATSSISQMSQVICYHIKGNKGHLAVGLDEFKSPTLPAGTTIPCAATKQCHMIMYSRPDGHTCHLLGDNSSAGLNVHIFPSKLQGGSCVTDVLFSSDTSTGLRSLCLGLGSSTQRCYKVDPNTAEPCKNQNCGAGACIVEGDNYACVCDDKHRGTACEIDVDVPLVG